MISLLEQAQTVAAKNAANERAQEFNQESQKQDNIARYWAYGSAGIAVVILVGCIGAMAGGSGPPLPNESWTVAANVSHFGARALAMSVMSFLLVISIRNYRSAKHNALTNGHRAKALQTFEKFKDVTQSRAQDVVLVQATTAIFSPQPTGYIDGSTGPGTHMTELLRAVRPDAPEEDS